MVLKKKIASAPCSCSCVAAHNIMFRYSRVVKACQLIEDIDMFPAGDMSELGPKGRLVAFTYYY